MKLCLIARFSLYHHRPIEQLYYCGRRPNMPVYLPFHFSLTHEKNPEIFGTSLLEGGTSLLPRVATHPFSSENYGPRFSIDDCHPDHFILIIEKEIYKLSQPGHLRPAASGNLLITNVSNKYVEHIQPLTIPSAAVPVQAGVDCSPRAIEPRHLQKADDMA